jgi:hypothetical protein
MGATTIRVINHFSEGSRAGVATIAP